MIERTELVQEIGAILWRRANTEVDDWDYCGWVFETTDGASYGGELYLFRKGRRLSINLGLEQRAAGQAMFRFREVTQAEGENYWIKCNTALRRTNTTIRMQYEYTDKSRWKITPANCENAMAVVLADLFPDAAKQ